MSVFCASERWHVRLGCGTKYSHHALPSQLSNVVKHVINLATSCNFPLSLKLCLNAIVLTAHWAISRVWSLNCRSISFGLPLSTGCNSLEEMLQLGAKYMCEENWEIIEKNTSIEKKKRDGSLNVYLTEVRRQNMDGWVSVTGYQFASLCLYFFLDGFKYA